MWCALNASITCQRVSEAVGSLVLAPLVVLIIDTLTKKQDLRQGDTRRQTHRQRHAHTRTHTPTHTASALKYLIFSKSNNFIDVVMAGDSPLRFTPAK